MFGDGKSPSEILQVLSPSVQQLINSGQKSSVRFLIKIDPTQFYATERFTLPGSKDITALPSGLRWIRDMGGKIIQQKGSQVIADIPVDKINDLASLPMFLYFDTETKMNAADIKVRALPAQVIPSIMSILKQEQFGLPVWSWIAIVSGLGVIWFGVHKRRT